MKPEGKSELFRMLAPTGIHEDMGTVAGVHRLEIEEAGHLLSDALGWLGDEHPLHCPRNRDDYDCTCGLDDLSERIKEWLARA